MQHLPTEISVETFLASQYVNSSRLEALGHSLEMSIIIFEKVMKILRDNILRSYRDSYVTLAFRDDYAWSLAQ